MPDLAARIRQALPKSIGLGQPQPDEPWPGEELAHAVPARLAEFRLGRSAARAAMRAVGLPPTSIPVKADRSPTWPRGTTGSISHCKDCCLAIAGPTSDWVGMGIDLEPELPLDPDLWPTILNEAEIAELPKDNPGLAALVLFVAKEAAYKAQFALSGQLIDFHDLAARQGPDYLVHLTFTRPIAPFGAGHPLVVQIVASDGLLAGFCLLPAV